MGVVSSPRAAKLAYGATFTLVLPLGLWLWNSHLRCPFPPIHSMWLGLVLLTAGTLLMVSGMWQLWSEGRGLPMNAFPPPRVVRAGVYAAVPHPIYCGFIAVCAGLAFAAGSATGLWLATPLAALGCLALVLGYESPDLRHRFGRDLPTPWLGPPAGSGSLPPLNRLGAALSVLAPWAVAYLAVKTLASPPLPSKPASVGNGRFLFFPQPCLSTRPSTSSSLSPFSFAPPVRKCGGLSSLPGTLSF